VIYYFIESLALSDVLSSLISLPVFVSDRLVLTSFVSSDLSCKISKYVMYFFPVVTCMNYLFISLERFFVIYLPGLVPYNKTAKKLVIAAWFIGALITLLPMPAMVPVKFHLPNNQYTMLCKYDSSVKYASAFFLTFTVCFYFIPFIVMFISCVMVARKVRKQRKAIPSISDETSNEQEIRTKLKNAKINYMFISLICAFIFPYFLYVCYNGAANLFKIKTSLTIDYVARSVSGILAFANGAVGSTILFRNFQYLRKKLALLYSNIFSRNEILPAIPNFVDMGGKGEEGRGARTGKAKS